MKRILFLTSFLLCYAIAQAQFNYSFTNLRNVISTYNGISATGTAIEMTDPQSGTSAALINIGFNFNFNRTTFTECMIHADGILRFGSVALGSHAELFANNWTTSGTIYTNPSYQNVGFALFMDLIQSSQAPTYNVLTEGVAPNRVTTLQWKDLKDNNSAGSILQGPFDALEFQVNLFETTKDIRIVYGNFGPSNNQASGKAG